MFKYGSEEFVYKSAKINKEGFLRYTADQDLKDRFTSKEISISTKQKFLVTDIKAEHFLEAGPEYIAEHELVREMEYHHIGTDGTIPNHIKSIIRKEYVEVVDEEAKTRRLKPTALGYALAEGYRSVDPDLFEPTVRKFIEKCSRRVEMFELYEEHVLDIVTKEIKKKLYNFMDKFDELIAPKLKEIKQNENLYEIEEYYKGLEKKVSGGDYLIETKRLIDD